MSIAFSADDRACTVTGPEGQQVRILFYAPGRNKWGETRVVLHEAGPMHLKEAFLGGAKENVILTLVPEGWTQADAVVSSSDASRQKVGFGHGSTSSVVDPSNLRDGFRDLIPKWLTKDGPQTTDQLYERARKECPELCGDQVCDCREAGDTIWQHQLRWAQQDLKESRRVELENGRWRIRSKGS